MAVQSLTATRPQPKQFGVDSSGGGVSLTCEVDIPATLGPAIARTF